MGEDLWIGLAVANFLACLAPGPNVALVTGLTLRGGLRSGVVAGIGILLAEALWSGAALSVYWGLKETMQGRILWLEGAGACVLIAFGGAALLSPAATRDGSIQERRRDVSCFGAGVFVGLANPLAVVFFLAIYPQFVPDGTLPSLGAAAFFMSAIVAAAAVALLPWTVLAARLEGGRLGAILHRVTGLSLVAMGLGGVIGTVG